MNPAAVFLHLYLGAFALAAGITFGAAFAFIPLVIGFAFLIALR